MSITSLTWIQEYPWLSVPVLSAALVWCLWQFIHWRRRCYENSPENPDWHSVESESPPESLLDEELDDSAGPAATPAP